MSRVAVQAFDDQLLAVLRDAGGVPLSTLDLRQGLGLPGPQSDAKVLRRCHALVAAGQVEEWPVPDSRGKYWRRCD